MGGNDDKIDTDKPPHWPTIDQGNADTSSESGESCGASSTSSSYSTIYKTIAPTISHWIGPVTVFFEGYSYDPTTDSGIRCSYPRAYLLHNNIVENPLPTLPLSRDHFGMNENENEGFGEKEFQVRLEEYVRLLHRGRVEDGYARKILATRTKRESKRKMSGDDPADRDWVPQTAEERAEGCHNSE
ncbi:hypothetical protein L211DRAFT_838114 [Terfezia boudieri ATCC MYA-4762]|uniref:Uncharacterized protein n=1 Tax=Terfezia boudieri ATCC MYA-4762 TaxID=1051890 RepID=A0A3N4LU78_9PEZI|nr:hypothetical protein L211DRAFT_838114 [Terfezia boudieri ATCC MYA-4762]